MHIHAAHRRAALAVMALALLVTAGCSRPRQTGSGPTPGTPSSQSPTAGSGSSAPASEGATVAPSPESPLITITKPKPAAPGTTRPTDAAVAAIAVKLGKEAGEFDTATSTKVLGVTQDSTGHWWAFVDIKYTTPDGEAEQQFILQNTGTKWEIAQNGTGLTYDDLPKDVRF